MIQSNGDTLMNISYLYDDKNLYIHVDDFSSHDDAISWVNHYCNWLYSDTYIADNYYVFEMEYDGDINGPNELFG